MSNKLYLISLENAVKLLKAALIIERKIDALDDILGDVFSEYLGEELYGIYHVVFDIMSFPSEDTTGDPDGYCRDWLFDKIRNQVESLPLCDFDAIDDERFKVFFDELENS